MLGAVPLVVVALTDTKQSSVMSVFRFGFIGTAALLLSVRHSLVSSSKSHSYKNLPTSDGIILRDLQLADVVYDLGNIRPEGIRVLSRTEADVLNLGDGSFALVSELLFGGVKAVNLETGEITQVLPSAEFEDRIGSAVAFASGYILLLGSGNLDDGKETLRIFDGALGILVATCIIEESGSFLIDVETVGTTAYISDAKKNILWSVDLTQVSFDVCNMVAEVVLPDAFLPASTDDFGGGGAFKNA